MSAAAVGAGLALAACGGTAVGETIPGDGGWPIGTGGTGGTPGTGGGPGQPVVGGAGGHPLTGGAGGVYGGPPGYGGFPTTGGTGGAGGSGGYPSTGGLGGVDGGAPGWGGIGAYGGTGGIGGTYGPPPVTGGRGGGGAAGAGGVYGGLAGADVCIAENDEMLCARRGMACGPIVARDNCGVNRAVASCGTCVQPTTCNGAGVCTGPADAGGCIDVVVGHPSAPCASYPTYAGFTLRLVEDFDQPIDLVSDPTWTYSDGYSDAFYTRYKKEAISFSEGKLVITATKPPGGVAGAGYPTYAAGTLQNYPAPVTVASTVQSGALRAKYNNWRFGRFEARVRAPTNNHSGNFIIDVSMLRTPVWQEWRQVDFEITPANAAAAVGTNLIYANACEAYGCTKNSYVTKLVPGYGTGATALDGFHTYSLETLPTRVSWYVDGTLVRTESGSGVALPDKSMKPEIALWVFSSSAWGGNSPDTNQYPMQTEIDWIRIYTYDQDTTYPCRPTPSCLISSDYDYAKNNAEDGVPAGGVSL